MRVRHIAMSVGMPVLVALALAQPAAADQPQCFGKDATIVGTNQSDLIPGTPGTT